MFKPKIGETYFSVGPLQHSGIEQWEWTNDRYDRSRALIGNVFDTKDKATEASAVIEYALKRLAI